jgi:hypothetical protein
VPLDDEEIIVAPASVDAEPTVVAAEPPPTAPASRWGRQ